MLILRKTNLTTKKVAIVTHRVHDSIYRCFFINLVSVSKN